MTYGKAIAIAENITDPTKYSIDEKRQACAVIANMATVNVVTKAALHKCIKFMLLDAYCVEGDEEATHE